MYMLVIVIYAAVYSRKEWFCWKI